jgi:hypothetical protein
MSDFEPMIRQALLQVDITTDFKSESTKLRIAAIREILRTTELKFPPLEQYLDLNTLIEVVSSNHPQGVLDSYIAEDRLTIRTLEDILTIDGTGRPDKAAKLLKLMENQDINHLKAEVAKVAKRRFL